MAENVHYIARKIHMYVCIFWVYGLFSGLKLFHGQVGDQTRFNFAPQTLEHNNV